MLATITNGLRRLFGGRHQPSGPPPQLIQLGEHLSHSCGGGLMCCGCGGFLTPVINRVEEGVQVAAIACLNCHSVSPLCDGVLIDGDAHSQTLH